MVASGPVALLAAAPKDRPAAPGKSSPGGPPHSTDGTAASKSGAGSDRGSGSTPGKATGQDKQAGKGSTGSSGKAIGQDKQADRGPVGNGHGKAKGHEKRPEPAPVDRPGTANPDPKGRDKPGSGPHKGPDQGTDPKERDDGREAPRTKETRATGGATTGRSDSGSGSSPSTGTLAAAREPVKADSRVSGVPKHTKASHAPPTFDAGPSLTTQLFAAGAERSEATKRFAFPLLLTVIVVLFLMLQGRFDGQDDKLSLAPVDYSEGLLTFE